MGWHLEKLCIENNIVVDGIFSNQATASNHLIPPDEFENYVGPEDFVFISVNDDRVLSVENRISLVGAIPIVCTGSIELDSLSNSKSIAFYPLYSFTKSILVNWSDFPVFIESTNVDLLERLKEIFSMASLNLVNCKPGERTIIHLAGVFMNNFTNSCAMGALNILRSKDLSFTHLLPILQQTVDKIIESKDPQIVQTGPAQRNDIKTIEKHLEVLESLPNEQAVYSAMSKYIQQNRR